MNTKSMLRVLPQDGMSIGEANLSLLPRDQFDGFWFISDRHRTEIGHIAHKVTGEYLLSWRVLPTVTETGEPRQVASEVVEGAVPAASAEEALRLIRERREKIQAIYAEGIRLRGLRQTVTER